MSEPTAIVCVAELAAVKFVFDAALAVITQSPVAVNVTSPEESEHGPDTPNVGATPEAAPVTVEMAFAVGVYVPLGSGDAGTADVNDTTCPA